MFDFRFDRISFHDLRPTTARECRRGFQQSRGHTLAAVVLVNEQAGDGPGGIKLLTREGPEIFIERTEEALGTGASVIATACPFCMTMITDGLKYKNKEEEIKNYDIAELIVQSLGL